MSMSAKYHAELWLAQSRTREEIEQRIEQNDNAIAKFRVKADNAGGDDAFGWTRAIHATNTENNILRQHLANSLTA